MGCTDPMAVNYSAAATLNDGSCVYELTNYTMQHVADLSSPSCDENSGIIFFDGHLWSINDGGNLNVIYQLDTTGIITREIVVSNALNIDWEGISQNSESIFIGDFGNNSGNREDLCVYEINKSEIQDPLVTDVTAIKRVFKYEDQSDFTWNSNAHNYDCEAFIATEDSLYLFSKNWLNEETNLYVLPTTWIDTAIASLNQNLNVDGLITDATINPISGRLMLLGYKNNGSNLYSSFIWVMWDFEENQFFTGNKRRIEIGSMFTLAQTEGIALKNGTSGFVSSEQISSVITIPAKLLRFDFSNYLEEELLQIHDQKGIELKISPNPAEQKIRLENFSGNYFVYEVASLKCVLQGTSGSKEIDVSSLRPGVYFIKSADSIVKFIKVKEQ